MILAQRLPDECTSCSKVKKDGAEESCSGMSSVCKCCKSIFEERTLSICKGFAEPVGKKYSAKDTHQECLVVFSSAMEQRDELCDVRYEYEVAMTDTTPKRFGDICDGSPPPGKVCLKIEPTFLRVATPGERIVSVTDGDIETHNFAQIGDYVAVNNTSDLEQYIVSAAVVATKYDLDHPFGVPPDHPEHEFLTRSGFQAFNPAGQGRMCLKVTAQELPPGGKFLGSWGSEMIVKVDDYLVCSVSKTDGITEVYRVERLLFEETYEIEPDWDEEP